MGRTIPRSVVLCKSGARRDFMLGHCAPIVPLWTPLSDGETRAIHHRAVTQIA